MAGTQKKIVVIGSGFSGLSAATHLAAEGYSVTVLEKNDQLGGRARQFEVDGFKFDMGPSWYWMPDVFDDYFRTFGKEVSDYYELVRLDPSYTVFFEEGKRVDLPANLDDLYALFESLEEGSSPKLKKFLAEAEYKYNVGMQEFVHKPGHSIFEFADFRVLRSLFKLQMLDNMENYLSGLFKNPLLLEILKFPVLFLGATPGNTPALYSLMNYADIVLGTWYPMGGMHKIIEAMVALAMEKGVQFMTNQEVVAIEGDRNGVQKVITKSGEFAADVCISSADYEHTEQKLLPEKYRQYSKKYWSSRVMAPSSLLYYIGVNKRLKNLNHHNLFFDEDFEVHAEEIYETPKWPSKPLFYACVPSVTDPSVAPEHCENLFLLMPAAPGLEDQEETRERYFDIMIDRLERISGQAIKPHIVYKRSFAHSDFINEYNSFKGNAYGLANILMQTAFLKPKLKSKKLKNMYFTGQLTTPGPGVPPSLISGAVVAREVQKSLA